MSLLVNANCLLAAYVQLSSAYFNYVEWTPLTDLVEVISGFTENACDETKVYQTECAAYTQESPQQQKEVISEINNANTCAARSR